MGLRGVVHHFTFVHQASVLQKVDSATHHYPTDKC